MATNRRVLAAAAVTALAAGGLAVSCSKGGSKESDDPTTPAATVGTLGIESAPISQSYPDGLTVAALSTDVSGEAETKVQTAAVGTVAISYDAALHDGAFALTQNPMGPAPMGPAPTGPAMGPATGPATPQTQGGCGPEPSPGKQCFDGTFSEMAASKESLASCVESRQTTIKARLESILAASTGSAAQKKEEADALSGKGDCIGPSLASALKTLKDQRDQDEDYDGYGQCYMPDWGIVTGKPEGSDELCLPSVTRAYLAEMDALVRVTLSLQRAMICQAIKDNEAEKDLEVDESKDFVGLFAKLSANLGGLTVKTAKIKRTNAEGKKRYDTDIVVGTTFGKKSDITMRVLHTPGDEKNAAYSGFINIYFPDRGKVASTESLNALSLAYERSLETVAGAETERLNYELRSGLFTAGSTPFGTGGHIDFNVTGGDPQPYKLIKADMYPALGVMKLSAFTNFGSSYDEVARGFIFDVRRVGGELKGCAIAGGHANSSGESASVRKATKEDFALYPLGWTQPFRCDPSKGTAPYVADKVWKQCFVRDANGRYVLDAEKTNGTTFFDEIAFADIPAEMQVPRSKSKPKAPTIGAGGVKQPAGPAGPASPAGPAMPQGPAVNPIGPAMPMNPAMQQPWKQACTICMQASCADKPAAPMDHCASGTTHAGDCCGMTCSGGAWGSYKCP